jgi:hypothetical protein
MLEEGQTGGAFMVFGGLLWSGRARNERSQESAGKETVPGAARAGLRFELTENERSDQHHSAKQSRDDRKDRPSPTMLRRMAS